MARVLAHHSITISLGTFLDSPGYVSAAFPGPGLGDTSLQGFSRHLHQVLGRPVHFPYTQGYGRVPLITSVDGSYVQTENVTLLQNPLARDTMDYLFVYRNTQRSRKTPIPLERGLCTITDDNLMGQSIQLSGGYAGGHFLAEAGQNLGYNAASLAHTGQFV
jgi:hypothetical protein